MENQKELEEKLNNFVPKNHQIIDSDASAIFEKPNQTSKEKYEEIKQYFLPIFKENTGYVLFVVTNMLMFDCAFKSSLGIKDLYGYDKMYWRELTFYFQDDQTL